MMGQADSNINLAVSLRRQHRRRMVLSGLVILAAGITLGIAGTLLVIRPTGTRPPMPPDRAVRVMLSRFKEELDLTEDQAAQIKGILEQHFQELESLREEARPKISKVFETLKSDVDGVLTEQQRDEWERLRERIDKQFHRGMARGPRGRGGPGRPREGFRDGRGPFRGPGAPPPDGEGGPGEWRREGRRPGDGRGSRRRRPDANTPPSELIETESDPNLL